MRGKQRVYFLKNTHCGVERIALTCPVGSIEDASFFIQQHSLDGGGTYIYPQIDGGGRFIRSSEIFHLSSRGTVL